MMHQAANARGQEQLFHTLQRRCWMFGYLWKYGSLNFSLMQEHWGISMRTYRRDLAMLRDIGVELEPDRRGDMFFRGFDPKRCDNVIVALRRAA